MKIKRKKKTKEKDHKVRARKAITNAKARTKDLSKIAKDGPQKYKKYNFEKEIVLKRSSIGCDPIKDFFRRHLKATLSTFHS